MSFSDWLTRTSMTSLAGLVMQIVWLVGSLVLTYVAADLLMTGVDDFHGKVPLSTNPEKLSESLTLYFAFADQFIKSRQSTGLILAGALFAAWGYGKTMNTIQHGKDRNTSKEKIIADGEADAIRHGGTNGHYTSERPAVKASQP